MRLLIIEDNIRMADLVAEGLGRRGFVCDIAHCLQAADAAMAGATFDALVLDLGLPDGDGIDWLVRQRRRSPNTPPAIILTARGALNDRIAGLDAGADDYVLKPVEIAELAARIRALLRRPGARSHAVIKVGALLFDSNSRSARAGEQPLDLARREADLLELLMRRAGTVVSREAIENTLYGFNDPVTPNALEAVISRLRRKLEEAGARDLLLTIRGVGYMLRDDS